MDIIGIGTDMIEIDRVIRACEKEHFLKRTFSKSEIEQMDDKRRRAASDFAGKEAVVKALKTGFAGIEPAEVEILRNDDGAPYVRLCGKAKKISDDMHIRKWHISISNTSDTVIAYVIAEA